MNTYQIGNKVTCIIRAFCSGEIGDVKITYDSEPYTILHDVSASLIFVDKDKNAKEGIRRELNYDISTLNQVKITNVHLTERILKLIFKQYGDALRSHVENVESDENGKVYLSTSEEIIYQVFVYNENLELAYAYGQINSNELVFEADKPYLVVYQTLSKNALNLDSNDNLYLTLDLICEGNTDEVTAPMYIHIHKAGIRVNRNIYFGKSLNAIDLIFNVINTDNNYIVLD